MATKRLQIWSESNFRLSIVCDVRWLLRDREIMDDYR